MCGIAGIFHYGNAKRIDADHLVGMRTTLRHRGPDGDGLYVHADLRVGLASTRLAIRDLSSAGDQPFVESASAIAVVFNGEIYNADELRSELEQTGVVFRSSSDTEVLLRLYCTYGEAMLAHLNGIFAFALPGKLTIAPVMLCVRHATEARGARGPPITETEPIASPRPPSCRRCC